MTVMGVSGLDIPAKFSCWANLAVTQLLVPQSSLTGHLCGIVAGLRHVYIPKAGTAPPGYSWRGLLIVTLLQLLLPLLLPGLLLSCTCW